MTEGTPFALGPPRALPAMQPGVGRSIILVAQYCLCHCLPWEVPHSWALAGLGCPGHYFHPAGEI